MSFINTAVVVCAALLLVAMMIPAMDAASWPRGGRKPGASGRPGPGPGSSGRPGPRGGPGAGGRPGPRGGPIGRPGPRGISASSFFGDGPLDNGPLGGNGPLGNGPLGNDPFDNVPLGGNGPLGNGLLGKGPPNNGPLMKSGSLTDFCEESTCFIACHDQLAISAGKIQVISQRMYIFVMKPTSQ